MMRVLGYRPHCASVFDAAINCVSQPNVCQTHGASFQATFCCVGDDVVGVVDAINQNKSSRRTEHYVVSSKQQLNGWSIGASFANFLDADLGSVENWG